MTLVTLAIIIFLASILVFIHRDSTSLHATKVVAAPKPSDLDVKANKKAFPEQNNEYLYKNLFDQSNKIMVSSLSNARSSYFHPCFFSNAIAVV